MHLLQLWRPKQTIEIPTLPDFVLPTEQHLQLLFSQPTQTTAMCFDLLFTTRYDDLTITCPQCNYLSTYAMSDASQKWLPVYQCGYSFCEHKIELRIPFMSSQSRLPIQLWLQLAHYLMRNPEATPSMIEKVLPLSWQTAQNMQKALQPYL